MLRMNYMVTQLQDKKLRAESKRLGISISEVLRKALDEYFRKATAKDL